MGTLGANQTGHFPQDSAFGLVKCVGVEKVAPSSLVVGQTQNESLIICCMGTQRCLRTENRCSHSWSDLDRQQSWDLGTCRQTELGEGANSKGKHKGSQKYFINYKKPKSPVSSFRFGGQQETCDCMTTHIILGRNYERLNIFKNKVFLGGIILDL